jgi:serine/threonine protein kinase
MPDTEAEHAGPYRLLEFLGEGGMGVVRRALGHDDREVAIKLLKPELTGNADFRHRLAREVDTMRRVRSPYVAEVLDADVSAQRPYVVTRFIQGLPLDDAVRAGGPLHGEPLRRVAAGLAEALVAIHGAGVVHRDLKPNNVMLVDGSPVVIDFGIAHAVDATRLTRLGQVVGTPGYMGPEIIEGTMPGPAVDVYGWAATVTFAAQP